MTHAKSSTTQGSAQQSKKPRRLSHYIRRFGGYARHPSMLAFGGGIASRGLSVIGSSLLSIAVARISGSAGLGQYSVFVSVLGVGAIFGRRGLDMIVMREVARNDIDKDQGNRVALLRRALTLAWPTLGAAGIVGALALASGVFGPPMDGAVLASLVCLPLLGALMIVSGYVKGAGLNWLSPAFEIGGSSLLAFGAISVAMLAGVALPTYLLPAILALSMMLASLLAFVIVRRDARISIKPLTRETSEAFKKGHIAFIIIMLSSFLAQSGAVLIAAPLLSPNQLGLIRAADRIALIIAFPALAIRPYIAPRIVQHLHYGARRGIWRLMQKSALAGIVLSGLPLCAILLFPEYILNLFGHGFEKSANYLRVLAIAQLMVLLLSPFSMILNMGGDENKDMWISIASLTIALVTFPLATISFGAAGFVGAYTIMVLLRVGLTLRAAHGLIERRCNEES